MPGIRRLTLQNPARKPFGDAHVAVEIGLTSGVRHLLIAADVENPMELTPSLTQGDNLVQNDWQVRLDGEMALIRKDNSGLARVVAGDKPSVAEIHLGVERKRKDLYG